MNRTFTTALLLLGILSGCVSAPIVPKKAMPPVNRSEVFGQHTSLTPWLDCLSGLLAGESGVIRLTVDSIPNTFGNPKGTSLPAEFRPFIQHSLSRVTNVYKIFDTRRLTGITGYSSVVFQAPGVMGEMAKTVLLSDIAQADYVLGGSLFLAQETKHARISAEVMAIGLNGEVKCYDVAVQLVTKNARTAEIVLQHSLKVRIYSAEQGLSVFSIHDGELTQADSGFFRAPSMLHGLQMLSDYLVAATIRDLSEALFKRSFASCDDHIPGLDVSRIPARLSRQAHSPAHWLRLVRNNGRVCLTGTGNMPASPLLPDERLEIRFQQYASSSTMAVPLGRPLRDFTTARDLLKGDSALCIPGQMIDYRAKNIECQVMDERQRIVGAALMGL